MDSYNRQLPIRSAIREGRIDDVREVIKSNLSEEDKYVYFHEAVYAYQIDAAELVLQSGFQAPFNDPDSNLLYNAIKMGGLKIVQRFLENGMKIDHGGCQCFSVNEEIPFYLPRISAREYTRYACNMHGYEAVWIYGRTALHVAVEKGDFETVTFLLENGANINSKDEFGISSLIISAEKGYTDIVEILLQHGADVNDTVDGTRFSNVTAIFCAAKNGLSDIVKMLVQYGATVDSMITCGWSSRIMPGTPLLIAVKNGNFEIAEHLLKSGANPELAIRSDETALFIAANEGHNDIVGLLLEFNAKADYKFDNIATNPLIICTRRGDFEIVKSFLKAGANFNFTDDFGRSILHFAVESGNRDLVSLFLELGENLDSRDKYGMTPLLFSAEKGFLEIVKLLLGKGADILTEDIYGRTALFIAAEEGHDEVVKVLIENGAPVDPLAKTNVASFYIQSERDCCTKFVIRSRLKRQNEEIAKQSSKIISESEKCWTPLLTAILVGHAEVVEVLLASGADPGKMYPSGKSAFYVASENRYGKVVQTLLRYGVNIVPRLESGESPLTIFTRERCAETVEALLKSGASTSFRNREGKTALDVTAVQGFDDIAEILLKYGAKAEPEGRICGDTPLIYFVMRGLSRIVGVLLEFGASPNSLDSCSKTALYNAVKNGFDDIVTLLLQKGANIDFKNKNGETALLTASYEGKLKAVEALLKLGADGNSADSVGRTPLYAATERRHHEIVKLLLEYGVKADLSIEKGVAPLKIPLVMASYNNDLEVVNTLLKFGANVNAVNTLGKTPLHTATERGCSEIVKLLVDYGADADLKDGDGNTPLHIALYASLRGSVQTDIIEILLKACASIECENDQGETPLYLACFLQLNWGRRSSFDLESLLRYASLDCLTVSEATVRKLLDLINDTNSPVLLVKEQQYKYQHTAHEALIKYVIQMKAANLFHWEEDLIENPIISSYCKYRYYSFQEKYVKQIADLKKLSFPIKNVTVYDMLSKTLNQETIIAKDPEVVDFFKGHGHPRMKRTFRGMINNSVFKYQFEKAVARNELLERSMQTCCRASSSFSMLPSEIIEYIFTYLSCKDLRTFIYAANGSSHEKFDYFDSLKIF